MEQGLNEGQVFRQRQLYGENTTGEDENMPDPIYKRVFEQICNPLIGLLLVSAVISLLLKQYDNTIGIVAAVILVGVVGAVQEAKTEATLEALRQLSPCMAHVVRSGIVKVVLAKEIVVGDIVEVRAGNRVPADLLIVSSNNLILDESVLTGESAGKAAGPNDLVFMGTSVNHGWGRGVVQAVGRATRFGKMVGLIKDARCTNKTTLQNELDALAHKLTVFSGFVIAGISIMNYVLNKEMSLLEIATTAVSLAVAAIPEGLPLVSTVTMALAVRRLARHGVIVKKMSAVEAMGGVKIICFDKTGTLTTNTLILCKFAFNEDEMDRLEFLRLSASCTDVSETDRGEFVGNALDVCLVKYFSSLVTSGNGIYGKQEAVLFSSEKRFMQVHIIDGRTIGKGAIEAFGCVSEQYLELSKEWSNSGLRVIGVGFKEQGQQFRLFGLIGFQDDLRSNAKEVISQLSSLSIVPVMLTGDGEGTAHCVARALSWPSNHIYSRQSPEDKLMFIDRMHKAGTSTAMIGDGVNDGAAVKRAQVGIAMGGPASTDVARQAADIVLLEDKLEGIVEAILEGRRIGVNVQCFLGFQVSSSMASLLLVGLGGFNSHLKLTPLHLLLLNIVMDGPPAQSLAMSHVPFTDLLNPPEIRLLDLKQFTACLLRAGLLVLGCTVYEMKSYGSNGLLPPLLLLSLANAYTWTEDLANKYLAGCTVITVLGLILASNISTIEKMLGVGKLGLHDWSLLIGLGVVYFVLVRGVSGTLRSMSARLRGYQKV